MVSFKTIIGAQRRVRLRSITDRGKNRFCDDDAYAAGPHESQNCCDQIYVRIGSLRTWNPPAPNLLDFNVIWNSRGTPFMCVFLLLTKPYSLDFCAVELAACDLSIRA
jgi:hypothetical protein